MDGAERDQLQVSASDVSDTLADGSSNPLLIDGREMPLFID
jgi:hypothetical protein